MKKINIGLVGFGNVGCGVVKVLKSRRHLLAEKIGSEIIIRKICDKDIVSKRSVTVPKEILTTDIADIINDPQIDIVVELIGGINPAKEFISLALKKAKILLRQIRRCLPSTETNYLPWLKISPNVFILKRL